MPTVQFNFDKHQKVHKENTEMMDLQNLEGTSQLGIIYDISKLGKPSQLGQPARGERPIINFIF